MKLTDLLSSKSHKHLLNLHALLKTGEKAKHLVNLGSLLENRKFHLEKLDSLLEMKNDNS